MNYYIFIEKINPSGKFRKIKYRKTLFTALKLYMSYAYKT